MFEKPETFDGLELDALRALSAEAIAEAQAIMAEDDDALTDEKIAQAEELMAASAEIDSRGRRARNRSMPSVPRRSPRSANRPRTPSPRPTR